MAARRGATAIEFALLLPVFLALIFGIIEFGWYFFQRSALDTAASLGCRAGALVDPGEGDSNLVAVEARAQEVMLETFAQGTASTRDASWTTTVETFGSIPSRSLRCIVSAQFEPIIGIYLSPRAYSATQAARLEWQR